VDLDGISVRRRPKETFQNQTDQVLGNVLEKQSCIGTKYLKLSSQYLFNTTHEKDAWTCDEEKGKSCD
jgi:hypothetical protein